MYDESLLLTISSAAQIELPKQEGAVPKVMVVNDVDLDILHYVLTAATYYGNRLRLNVFGRSMLDMVYILDVVEVLGLIPPQMQVESQLVHKLTHKDISTKVMTVIHQLFGAQRENSRAWRTMIHQLAWDVTHEKLTGAKLAEMSSAARQFPNLDHAVQQRIAYLKGCKEHKQREEAKAGYHSLKREFMDGRKSSTKQAHKFKGAKQQGKKKSASLPNVQSPSFHEKNQQKWVEEEEGLRETSQHTATYLMHLKPMGFWVKPKMSQGEKKKTLRAQANDSGKDGEVGEEGDVPENAGEEGGDNSVDVEA